MQDLTFIQAESPIKFYRPLNSYLKELDYVLIEVDEGQMQSLGMKPILADSSNLPIVKENDNVYIIQHPEGKEKHFSTDKIKCVKKPYIEYYADTMEGSSGSPVFVVRESKLSPVALHNKGVKCSPSNYNKGVLLSDILDHFHKEQGKIYCFLHCGNTVITRIWKRRQRKKP